jgi:hypothetical protein
MGMTKLMGDGISVIFINVVTFTFKFKFSKKFFGKTCEDISNLRKVGSIIV